MSGVQHENQKRKCCFYASAKKGHKINQIVGLNKEIPKIVNLILTESYKAKLYW